MRGGTQTRLNCMNSVIEENRRNLSLHKMARVSRPVDITDAEQFPEIARAIAHARKMRGEV